MEEIVYQSFCDRLNGQDTRVFCPRAEYHNDVYSDLIMKKIGRSELVRVISSFKNNKAPGPHGLKADLLKLLTRSGLQYLRVWLNRVFAEHCIDPYLNEGRVVLIYKKGSKFDPLSYRPITLGTILSKVVARVLNRRMSEVIERDRLLDDLQMGFRKNHSSADPVLLTSVIIDKAKIEKKDLHLVLVDIQAAYDTVRRSELFYAMDQLGFGGSICGLFRSLYTHDYVRFDVNGHLTGKMYLREGLKQGCSTSPMAYNIFKREIVDRMNCQSTGFKVDGLSVSAVFYADDVVIFGRSKEDALLMFDKFRDLCDGVGLKVNIKKSKMLTGNEVYVALQKVTPEALEVVLVKEYLGAPLQIGRNLFQVAYSESRVSKARMHATACLSLARSAPDPIGFALTIWRSVALPSILYATESLPLRQREIKLIESEQARIARFVLQLPSRSGNAATYLLAGLRPFKIVLWERLLKNFARLRDLPPHHLARRALNESISLGKRCNYNRVVNNISDELGWDGDIDTLGQCLDSYCAEYVNLECDRLYKSSGLLRRASEENPVRTSILLRFDAIGKAYHEFMTFDAGLGNRSPIPGLPVIKLCPLCVERGRERKLFEPHVMFACPSVRDVRDRLGIIGFMVNRPSLTTRKLYKDYWTGRISRDEMLDRICIAQEIVHFYLERMMSCLTGL